MSRRAGGGCQVEGLQWGQSFGFMSVSGDGGGGRKMLTEASEGDVEVMGAVWSLGILSGRFGWCRGGEGERVDPGCAGSGERHANGALRTGG